MSTAICNRRYQLILWIYPCPGQPWGKSSNCHCLNFVGCERWNLFTPLTGSTRWFRCKYFGILLNYASLTFCHGRLYHCYPVSIIIGKFNKWTPIESIICSLFTPSLKVQFSDMLEGDCLAISASGTYATMPTLHLVHICLGTQGHLCSLNTAPYPVKKIKMMCLCSIY